MSVDCFPGVVPGHKARHRWIWDANTMMLLLKDRVSSSCMGEASASRVGGGDSLVREVAHLGGVFVVRCCSRCVAGKLGSLMWRGAGGAGAEEVRGSRRSRGKGESNRCLAASVGVLALAPCVRACRARAGPSSAPTSPGARHTTRRPAPTWPCCAAPLDARRPRPRLAPSAPMPASPHRGGDSRAAAAAAALCALLLSVAGPAAAAAAATAGAQPALAPSPFDDPAACGLAQVGGPAPGP